MLGRGREEEQEEEIAPPAGWILFRRPLCLSKRHRPPFVVCPPKEDRRSNEKCKHETSRKGEEERERETYAHHHALHTHTHTHRETERDLMGGGTSPPPRLALKNWRRTRHWHSRLKEGRRPGGDQVGASDLPFTRSHCPETGDLLSTCINLFRLPDGGRRRRRRRRRRRSRRRREGTHALTPQRGEGGAGGARGERKALLIPPASFFFRRAIEE